jgi:uncharacterized protein (DUF952 family)
MAIPDDAFAYHLVPIDSWEAAPPGAPFRASSLEGEGFIHLTHSRADLLDVANRYYCVDPRPFVVLSVFLPRLTAPWRYDGDIRYPHVYGPLDREAITAIEPMLRSADGSFLQFDLARG